MQCSSTGIILPLFLTPQQQHLYRRLLTQLLAAMGNGSNETRTHARAFRETWSRQKRATRPLKLRIE